MSGCLASDAPQHESRHNFWLAGDFPEPPHKTAKGDPPAPGCLFLYLHFPRRPRLSTVPPSFHKANIVVHYRVSRSIHSFLRTYDIYPTVLKSRQLTTQLSRLENPDLNSRVIQLTASLRLPPQCSSSLLPLSRLSLLPPMSPPSRCPTGRQ